MGIPVMILGATGSGKTYSIKNFEVDEVGIFSVEKGRLPFKKKFKVAKNAKYQTIFQVLSDPKLKTYVIDDSQYLLVNEMFDRAKDTGYGKFTDMALNFRNLIHYINQKVPDDVIVYFLHHTETDNNTSKVKAKTVGKMIDNQLTLEGLFSIVLICVTDGKKHSFITQSDGFTTAKSPMEMFPDVIDNDLKAVDQTIREYYELNNKGE